MIRAFGEGLLMATFNRSLQSSNVRLWRESLPQQAQRISSPVLTGEVPARATARSAARGQAPRAEDLPPPYLRGRCPRSGRRGLLPALQLRVDHCDETVGAGAVPSRQQAERGDSDPNGRSREVGVWDNVGSRARPLGGQEQFGRWRGRVTNHEAQTLNRPMCWLKGEDL